MKDERFELGGDRVGAAGGYAMGGPMAGGGDAPKSIEKEDEQPESDKKKDDGDGNGDKGFPGGSGGDARGFPGGSGGDSA